MYFETKLRSIVKAVSWRFWATLTTIVLVFSFTRQITIAATIGFVEIFAKMALYFFHERAWNKINLGRRHVEPFVLWFTGLSGSGKSTLAERVFADLKKQGYRVERLDGDVIRSIFPNTGFSRADRNSHIKRVGFLASILEKNGVMVVASFVSPYREARDFVRKNCKNFIEIYVNAPLEICQKRDPKGLYAQVKDGKIKNFTGIDDPYEVPDNPELTLLTDTQTVEESISLIKKQIASFINNKK